MYQYAYEETEVWDREEKCIETQDDDKNEPCTHIPTGFVIDLGGVTPSGLTNEEMVQLIQSGRDDLIQHLWEQVFRFICKMVKVRLINEPDHVKQLEPDLISESYFAFMKAVQVYKSDYNASFLHYLTFHLKNAFNYTLGLKITRTRS